MENRHTQITVILDLSEMAALRSSANSALRRPRDQARHIIRQALGLDLAAKRDNAGATPTTERTGIATANR